MPKNYPEITPDILIEFPGFQHLNMEEAAKITEKIKEVALMIFNYTLKRKGRSLNIA